jgi:anti-sigma B factor antagonist
MLDYYDSEMELLGDVGVLAVMGETDLASAPQLRRDLDEIMEASPGDVVLDLTELDLVDSTALGLMMAAAGRMMIERRALVLVVTRRHVLRVLTITGLRDLFSIVSTRAEALTRLSSGWAARKVA